MVGRGQFLQGFGFLKLEFPHPVKGEPVQQSMVVLSATHPKELPFEAVPPWWSGVMTWHPVTV